MSTHGNGQGSDGVSGATHSPKDTIEVMEEVWIQEVPDRPEFAPPEDPATTGTIVRLPDALTQGLVGPMCALVGTINGGTAQLLPLIFPGEGFEPHELDEHVGWEDSPFAVFSNFGDFYVRRWHPLSCPVGHLRSFGAVATLAGFDALASASVVPALTADEESTTGVQDWNEVPGRLTS